MKQFLSFVFLVVCVFFSGCGVVGIGLNTNLPIARADGVVVTCPLSVGKVVLKKYSRFSNGEQYVVLPGRETKVSADGVFSDQNITLVGFVYNKSNQVIGRVSREFSFDGNSRQVKIHQWHISRWEATSSENDWFW